MATYFTLDKTAGKGNGTVNVTPMATFKGRGPVTNTVVVTSQDRSTVKGSVVCSKTNALSKGTVNFYGCTSATGEFTAITVTDNKIAIPNTAYYIKITVSLTNAKKIKFSSTPNYLSIKYNASYMGATGAASETQVDCKALIATNAAGIPIPGDPGVLTEFPVEIIMGYAAQTMAEPRSFTQAVHLVGSSDTELQPLFSGTINQAAAAPTLSVNPTTLTWGNTETQAKGITVTSNDDWTVTIS